MMNMQDAASSRPKYGGAPYHGNTAHTGINLRRTGIAVIFVSVIADIVALVWLICIGSLVRWDNHDHLHKNLSGTEEKGTIHWQWIYVVPILLVVSNSLGLSAGVTFIGRPIKHHRAHTMLGIFMMVTPLALAASGGLFGAWTLRSERAYDLYSINLEALGCKDHFGAACGVKDETNGIYQQYRFLVVHVVLLALGCLSFFLAILVSVAITLPVLCPTKKNYARAEDHTNGDADYCTNGPHYLYL